MSTPGFGSNDLIGRAAAALYYYVRASPGHQQMEEFERRFDNLLDDLCAAQGESPAVKEEWKRVHEALAVLARAVPFAVKKEE